MPDGAFRPLEDWVDYIIEAEQKPLAAWIEATRFDFDHFICNEAGGPKTKPDKGDKELRGRNEDDAARPRSGAAATQEHGRRLERAPAGRCDCRFLAPPEEIRKPPASGRFAATELEKQFLRSRAASTPRSG